LFTQKLWQSQELPSSRSEAVVKKSSSNPDDVSTFWVNISSLAAAADGERFKTAAHVRNAKVDAPTMPQESSVLLMAYNPETSVELEVKVLFSSEFKDEQRGIAAPKRKVRLRMRFIV